MRLVVLCFLLSAAVAWADAPKITRITPTGVQIGATTDLKLTGKPNGQLKVWSDCKGLSFEFSEKFDSVKIKASKDVVPGQWWLRFYNDDGASQLLKLFVGGLPEVVEAEPNDTSKKPQQLTTGSVVTGVLAKAGDVDVYSIPLKKGQTFIARMNAHRMGSPMDGVLQLLDGRGVVLTQNDEGLGFDPQIVYEVPRDGTYMVRAFAFPAAPNSTIRFAGASNYVYRLELTTGPVISHALPMFVQSGEAREVELLGWNLKAFKATPFQAWDAKTRRVTSGSATLDLPIVHRVCRVESDQVLEVPLSVSGTIGARGEVDSIRFTAKKSRVELSVVAQSAYSNLDPVVAIRTKAGKLIKEFDDISRTNRDIKTSLNLPADDEYVAEVRDRFGNAGFGHNYGLLIGKSPPGFTATLAADAFAATTDKPLEIPIKIERIGGFAEKIQFRVSTDAEGISAATVTSEHGSATEKTVKLLVRCTKAVSGPLRIQCVAGETTSFATSPAGIADHWLTVRGK